MHFHQNEINAPSRQLSVLMFTQIVPICVAFFRSQLNAKLWNVCLMAADAWNTRHDCVSGMDTSGENSRYSTGQSIWVQ